MQDSGTSRGAQTTFRASRPGPGTVLDPPTGQTHYRDCPIRPLLADQLRLQIVLYLICVEIDRSKFGDRLDTERLEGLS